jgi:hypothetical protein
LPGGVSGWFEETLRPLLADGRGRALAQLADATPCGVCEDLYPVGHLLVIAAGPAEVPLCPACAFDGEVFDIDDYAAASLAYQIYRLASGDLAMPAGWTGIAALLACMAPAGFGDRLERWWRQAGTLFIPPITGRTRNCCGCGCPQASGLRRSIASDREQGLSPP